MDLIEGPVHKVHPLIFSCKALPMANDAQSSVVRWGILSTAKIAREHLMPALNRASNCEVVAVGSRDIEKANKFGDKFGIERRHGSYEDLLADPEVDAIYNPLPNHLHDVVTLQAAAAGKHVLCEKPFTLDMGQAEKLKADLAALPTQVKVMEAFMYQFHPQWTAVLDMVRNGRIGSLVTVQTWFSYFGDDPANIRHNPDWGGGALMDIGCYAIHSARQLFGSEPTRVQGTLEIHPTFGVDVTCSGILDFDSGHASFTVSTQSDGDQRVHIVGTEGRIEITRPFNAIADRPMVVRVGSGMGETYADPLDDIAFGPADQYSLMAECFAASILADEPVPVSLDDAINNMRVIDAIRGAAE